MNNDNRTVFCWPWPRGIMAGAVTALFPHPGLSTGEWCWQGKGTLSAPQNNSCPAPCCSVTLHLKHRDPQPLPRCLLQKMNGRSSVCHVLGRGPPRAALLPGEAGLAGRALLPPSVGTRKVLAACAHHQAEAESLFLIPRMGFICEKRV